MTDAPSAADAETVMHEVLEHRVRPEQLGALLGSLAVRPPTGLVLAGFARAFFVHADLAEIPAAHDAIDVCGTGGDAGATINVSTAVAFVVAALGVRVAKHGNRAVSSRCGSLDVLEALGVRVADTAEEVEHDLQRANLSFLAASSFYPSFRALRSFREALGFRTVFNVLGPILNPARVRRQLIGVYDRSLLLPVAEALRELGTNSALIVHGLDGSDELSLSGASEIVQLHGDGSITRQMIVPKELGLTSVPPAKLRGGSRERNAHEIERLLGGAGGAASELVALNAAAALVAAGHAETLATGLRLAQDSLAQGEPFRVLQRLRETPAVGVSP